jgi:hypothetical protein
MGATKQKTKLDTREARRDLTSREISILLGGFLGTLTNLSDIENIKTAVMWWAETPEAWEGLRTIKELQKVTYTNSIKGSETGLE